MVKSELFSTNNPETAGKKPTTLSRLLEQLSANPKVYVAGQVHEYHPSAPEYGYHSETVNIVVAPTSPLFTAAELNNFMYGLFPTIEFTSRDEAVDQGGDIRVGKLYFDEQIGTQHQVIITTIKSDEPDTLSRADKSVGTTREEVTRKLMRRTWVTIYPDPITANALYQYLAGRQNNTIEYDEGHDNAKYRIKEQQVAELKKHYQAGPFSKLKQLFSK